MFLDSESSFLLSFPAVEPISNSKYFSSHQTNNIRTATTQTSRVLRTSNCSRKPNGSEQPKITAQTHQHTHSKQKQRHHS